MTAQLHKRCRIGTWTEIGYKGRLALVVDVHVDVDGELRITGDTREGMGTVSGGQNIDDLAQITDYADGWDAEKVRRLTDIWERWHMNYLRPGSPAQMEYLRDSLITVAYPESHFHRAIVALEVAGLQPDPGHIIDGEPYSYGSLWLKEELPSAIIDELVALTNGGVNL